MKQKGRYILMNEDGVMWQRRWLFKWFGNFESFENRKILKRQKILKQLAALKKEVDEYRVIEREEQSIIREIKTSRDCERNCGPVKVRDFPFFSYFTSRIKDLAPAPNGWKEIVAFLKGSSNKTIAENLSGTIGAEITQMNGESIADDIHKKRGELPIAGPVVSTKDHRIVPESTNQQKKQRGNQQNNQQ